MFIELKTRKLYNSLEEAILNNPTETEFAMVKVLPNGYGMLVTRLIDLPF